MVLPRLALPRLPRFSADQSTSGRFRPSVFDSIQALLVLWMVAVEFVNISAGLDILPLPPRNETEPAPSPGAVILRGLHAAIYPAVALLMSRRFPLWDGARRQIGYYLGGLLLLHATAYFSGVLAGQPGIGPSPGWAFFARKTFEFALFTVFGHAMAYGERYHRNEQEELRLRAEMAESTAERVRAQMRNLSMQWSPGFLTRTLDSIGDLLARDVAGAKRMLLHLSSVLRHVLSHLRTDEVRLEKEIELVREVLAVEALRRPGLAAEWVVDESALDCAVAPMSLLTLVHRALQQYTDENPPQLRISAAPSGAAVRLRVDVFGAQTGDRATPSGHAGTGQPPQAEIPGYEIHRSWPAPGWLHLELRYAPEPHRAVAGRERNRPEMDTGGPRGPAAPAELRLPGETVTGRALAIGTYATLILAAVVFAVHRAGLAVAQGNVTLASPAWVYIAGSGLYVALWWGSLAATAHAVSARYPMRRGNWPGRLMLHIAAVVAVAFLNVLAAFPFQRYAVEGGSIFIGLLSLWEWGSLVAYLPLAGIAHGFAYAREYRAKRLSELQLRSQLSESELHRTEAELQALKAELNPHFLFNALNTVSSLMHTRAGEAQRVVRHLSALLQRVLDSSSLQEVSVEEEIEFLRLYLEIEQARFGDALRIEYHLDPAALGARVPHLLLQPLVENAVKHGLRPRGGTGHITLSAQRLGSLLELAVADDGVGLASPSAAEGTGTGLANVRKRLQQLYGSEYEFSLTPAPGGGTLARVRIPFSEPPAVPVQNDAFAAGVA